MKKILSLVLLVTSANIFSQNCDASFSFDILQQGYVEFFDLSINSDSSQAVSWFWDFGDGTSSTEQNPSHFYSDFSHNYYVCLTATFNDSCSSTFCDSVYFIVPCNMYLTYTKTDVSTYGGNDGSIDITIHDNAGDLSYYWDTGQITEDIYNLTAGTYTIHVFDNTTNCQIDSSITIIEPPVDSCNMYLTYTKTDVSTYGGDDGSIDVSVFNNTGYVQYIWNTGATTEDLSNLTAGIYNVTLTDSLGCQVDTSITIIEPELTLSLIGNVYAKTAPLPNGIAVLIKKDQTNYKAISYTHITNGYYIFNNLDTAEYLVYAYPHFSINANYYPIYFPTYSGNNIHYENAQTIYVDSIQTKDISLEYNEEINHGHGYISGRIVYDSGSDFETSIYNHNWFGGTKTSYEGVAQNTAVFLLNNYNNAIKYSLSDNNGKFEIKDIPYGEYTIYTEKAGRTTHVINVTLSAENDSSTNNIIHIQQENVIEVKYINNNIIKIYPNPFTNYITIKGYQLKNIKIINLFGKILNYGNCEVINTHTYRINTYNLTKGVYFIQAEYPNGNIITKKIIKN